MLATRDLWTGMQSSLQFAQQPANHEKKQNIKTLVEIPQSQATDMTFGPVSLI